MGNTALHLAYANNFIEVAGLLLEGDKTDFHFSEKTKIGRVGNVV